jgi:uncharacterized protein with gpF-like domain
VRFALANMVKRPSKRPITLARIETTHAQASDLFGLYARVIAAWVAGKAPIIAEYEHTLKGMQHDSAETTGGAIDNVSAEINRLVLLLTPDLRRWALNVEKVHRGKWTRSVLSATDVDLNTVLTPGDVEDTVGASVNWNMALIKDVSSETQKRIANSVFAGFQRRAPAAEIAREISDATDMARRRALNIASDQTTKLGGQLNRARQLQAGIKKFRWRHGAKRHPRIWHLERDGRLFDWENPGIAADDMPSIPPWCSCTAQGVLSFDD